MRETERSSGTRSPRETRSPRSPRTKTKSAHKVGEVESERLEEEMNNAVFATKFNATK